MRVQVVENPGEVRGFNVTMIEPARQTYSQTSNTSRTLVGNCIHDHSDVVRASPVGAAPTTSSVST